MQSKEKPVYVFHSIAWGFISDTGLESEWYLNIHLF